MTKKLLFFDGCFDKNRIKSLISWSVVHCGENSTINLVENLKNLGYAYATQAGVSLGLDDLKIPTTKPNLISDAEKEIQVTQINSKHDYVTGIEKFQQLIDTWNRTSERLKQSVIQYFKATDILNPVYMMAFSGARGNISQVRQLVGMRGLMSDPQGQILDFPIKSNFREGLTLTEYIISCYGARKGIVDTALKTANSGYLTRRLVDVSHHVIICDFDCKTSRGIVLNDIIENQKIILPLQIRLIGRILAENIYSTDASEKSGLNVSQLKLASENKKQNYLIAPYHLKINKTTQIPKKLIFSNFGNPDEVTKSRFAESNLNNHFVFNKPKIKKFLYVPQNNLEWLQIQQNIARACALFFEIASLYFADVSILISKNKSEKNANIFFSNGNLFTSQYLSLEKIPQSNFDLNQLLLFLNYVHFYDTKKKLIALKNTEISSQLAAKIGFLKKNVLVRSPLTCEIKNSVCQLCYGWSLAYGKLVSLGEAVGVIAAQSIGEPGTQLTMRTFHTGGVFSGDVMSEITAPCNGIVHFPKSFQGMLIRTPHGKIAFLTKVPGTFEICPTQIQNSVLSEQDKLSIDNKIQQNHIIFHIPAFTILFIRNHEFVNKTQVIAEFSAISTDRNQRILSRYDVKSEIEGEVIFDSDTGRRLIKIKIEKERAKILKGKKLDLGIMSNVLDPKEDKLLSRTTMQVGTMWILSSKIYRQRIPVSIFPQPGDIVDTNSIFGQYESMSLYNGFITFQSKKSEISRPIKNTLPLATLKGVPLQQVRKPSFLTTINKNKETLSDNLIDFNKFKSIKKVKIKQKSSIPFIYKSFINETIISFAIHSIQYKKIGYFFSFFNSKKSRLHLDHFFLSNSLNQRFEASTTLKTHFYFQSFPKMYKTETGGIAIIDQFYVHEKMYYGEIFWISEEIYMFNSQNLIFIKPTSNSAFLKNNYTFSYAKGCTFLEKQIAGKKKYKKWITKNSPLIFYTNSQGKVSDFYCTGYGHIEMDELYLCKKNRLSKFPLPKQQIKYCNNTPLKRKNGKQSFLKMNAFSETKKNKNASVAKQPYWELVDQRTKRDFVDSLVASVALRIKKQSFFISKGQVKGFSKTLSQSNLSATLKSVPVGFFDKIKKLRQNLKPKKIIELSNFNSKVLMSKNKKFRKNPHFYLNFLKSNRNTKRIKHNIQLEYYFLYYQKQNKKIDVKIIQNNYCSVLQPQFPFSSLLNLKDLINQFSKKQSKLTYSSTFLHLRSTLQCKTQVQNKIKFKIKSGWIYFPSNLKQIINKHKCIIKPGLNCCDGVIFDQYPVFLECLSISKISIQHKKIILKKTIHLKRILNILYICTKFEVSICEKTHIEDRSNFGLVPLDQVFLSIYNTLFFSNNLNIDKILYNSKMQSIVSGIFYKSLSLDRYIKENTFSNFFLLLNLQLLRKSDPMIIPINGLLTNFGEKMYFYEKIYFLNSKNPGTPFSVTEGLPMTNKDLFKKKVENVEKTSTKFVTAQFSETNQLYDFSTNIRKTSIYSYTQNFFMPKFCVLVRKISSYPITRSLQYKRLLTQENQSNVHSFLNPYISLNNYHNYTKLSSFTKQNSTSLYFNMPACDFFVQPYFKDKEWKNNYFTKNISILEFCILFTLPQNSLLTDSKIDVIVKKNISLLPSLPMTNDKLSLVNQDSLKSNLVTKQLNLASKFIHPMRLNNSGFLKTAEQETKNIFLQCLNVTSKTKNTIVFTSTMCFNVSLFQKIQFSYLASQSFSNKTSTLVQTQILVSDENSIANQAPASVTTFFSPYQGEILTALKRKVKLNEDALRLYNKYETLVDRDGLKKHTYLILTDEDQISFSSTSSNYPINPKNIQINALYQPSILLLGQFIKYGTKIQNNLALSESGQIIQIEKSKLILRKAQSILFSPNGFLSVHHGDMIEKNALVLSLYYQRLKTGDIVQGIPKIEQLFEARQTYQGEKLVGSLHAQLEWLFYRYQSENNPQQAARRSIEKIQQIIVQNVQKVYQSQGVRIAEKHLEIIVRQMTSKVQIISGKNSLFLPGELVELDWIENANKGIEIQENRAIYKPIIQGITKKSLDTKSFISEASFQETTRILTKSAIQRKTDFLKGLKENVILGHVIPAGTGFIGKILDPNKGKYISQSTLQSRYKSYTFFRNIFFETISEDINN